MRVLVIEDERGLVDALRRGLGAEGFAVDIATDGTSGLVLAETGDYDIVLLDIMLPGVHGYDVVTRLRAAQVWTPVLMVSAKDGEYDIADALDVGADDYLTKPFSFVELLARMRALLRRGAPPRPSVLTSGDLTLDPAARRVFRAGVEIEMTAREFALLEYLMRRRGQVVAKSELLDGVWDTGDTVNVVEVYVGYLRRKVGADAIETVRGSGYRIPEPADLAQAGGAPGAGAGPQGAQ